MNLPFRLRKPQLVRRTRLPLACMTVLLWSVPHSGGQETKFKTMQGVNRGQPAAPRSTLVISINEIVGGIAEPGWPLVISATTMSEDPSASIPPPSGLELKLTDGKGTGAGVTLQPVAPPTTDAENTTRYWLAPETATARLTPQQYRVTLATPSGNLPGWRIETGEFQIVAPNPERNRLLGYLKIERSNVLGNHDEALAEANRLIAANDKDQQAWIVKGDILMLKDDPNAALQAFDRALGLRKKTEREPVAIQARRRDALLRSLEKRGGVTATQAP